MTEIITSDTRVLDELGQKLRDGANDAYRRLQNTIRDIGENQIASKARENASWSHKIPPTIKARASGLRTVVSAGNADVPIAVWYEQGRTSSGPWRHPLFGNRRHWYSQRDPSRPYLKPALESVQDDAAQQIADAAAQAVSDNLI